jgi:hypothetical protein
MTRSAASLRRLAALALAALLAGAIPAAARTCAADPVPGATLLLPYFEVDLDDPNGLTTLFSIDNASAAAVVAHVVVWSDLAVPVFNFDVYLTGYDVQSLNLRDLLAHGGLPQTASNSQDPSDIISPKGPYSQDLSLPSCAGKLPPPPMSAAELAHVQAALTGRASSLAGGLCLGRYLGDRVARGYVTVDTVGGCTARVPGDPGYFADATHSGDAIDQNVLWGTWYIVNAAHNYAQGGPLAALEASASDPETSTSGRYTFYGRYVGWSAADHREPLATQFAAQYAVGATFGGAADFIVWRDPKVAQGPFDCATPPAWYPLSQEDVVLFDEEEHPQALQVLPVDPPPPPPPLLAFAAATQRARVGGVDLPVPYSFGWMDLDLNTTVPGVAAPPFDTAAAQAWVMAVQSADGRYATGALAFQLDSACHPDHLYLPGSF